MKLPLRRKVGHAAKLFDAVVDCAHFNLPPHPRRIKTTAPLTRVTPDRFARVAQRTSDSDASLGSGLRRWELAIDSTGPAEILDGGVYGPLVPVGDAVALAMAIESVLDSPPERERATIAPIARRSGISRYCSGLPAPLRPANSRQGGVAQG